MIRQKLVLLSVICIIALTLLSTSQPLNRAAAQSLDWIAGSDLVGQIGGGSYAVDYAGGYIYTGAGPRVYIYNAFILGSPFRVAVSALLPGIVQDVKAAGDYLFASLGEGGLAVLNVSIKSAPVVVSIYDTPGFAKGLWLANEYLYVADGTNGVVKLNVSNPSAVQLTATFDKSSNARDVMVSNPNGLLGDKLFIADGSAGILALLPTDGAYVDVVDTPGFAEALAIIPPNIYLADGSSGIELYQFTDQNTFKLDNFIYQNDTPGYAQDVITYDPYIYLADGTGGFTVFNRIPDALLLKGNYNSPGIACGLDLQLFPEGIFLFLADFSGMQVVTVADITHPTGFGPYKFTPVPARAAVSGTAVYAADPWLGLHIIDTANPTQPLLKGSLGYETVWGVKDVAVVDPYAYLADGADGLRIVDISNPAAPVLTQTIDTPGDAVGVAVVGGLAYIADGSNGLVEINLSSTAMRGIITPGYASDVAVAGDYAYLAAGESGLLIFNRLPDGDLTLAGALDTAGVAATLAYKDGLIYLADGAKGLRIIDVTNPASPREVGFYDPAKDVVDAVVWERWVFAAEKDHGVSALDITVPSRPSLVKFYDTPGAASGVVVDDRGVYIADEQGGLLIYQRPNYKVHIPLIVR